MHNCWILGEQEHLILRFSLGTIRNIRNGILWTWDKYRCKHDSHHELRVSDSAEVSYLSVQWYYTVLPLTWLIWPCIQLTQDTTGGIYRNECKQCCCTFLTKSQNRACMYLVAIGILKEPSNNEVTAFINCYTKKTTVIKMDHTWNYWKMAMHCHVSH